ncbi:hypothetical protein C1X59_19295 [Pseudomonas sp. FW215-R2]|nr:hypothetical protein C1X59_19295 [Pseudomonas sp. FW215-R2]PNA30891.1 hypothetical protein C1X58_08375 [Pseudomonas sp. FW215-R4]
MDNGVVVASGVFNQSSAFIQQLVNLAQGPHRFELRENASLPATDVWILTVGAVETLSIDSIKGLLNGVEIPEGTSTSEKLFALSGKARVNATVDLYDNGVIVAGPIAVDVYGNWTYNTSSQAPGPHSYTIKGKYDSGPESTPPRTMTIVQALSIDTSVMRLAGIMIRSPYAPNLNGVDAVGNTEVRIATGGIPPYVIGSSNHAVVTYRNGKFVGMGNGSATITVTDQQNKSVQFTVVVSNIYDLVVGVFSPTGVWSHPLYLQLLPRRNYLPLTPALRVVMERCFQHPWFSWAVTPANPAGHRAWMGPTSGVAQAEAYDAYTKSIVALNASVELHNGLCFFPKPAAGMTSLENTDALEDGALALTLLPDSSGRRL